MIHSKEPMLVPQASAAQYIVDLAIAELTEAPILEDLTDILFDNTLDNKDPNLDIEHFWLLEQHGPEPDDPYPGKKDSTFLAEFATIRDFLDYADNWARRSSLTSPTNEQMIIDFACAQVYSALLEAMDKTRDQPPQSMVEFFDEEKSDDDWHEFLMEYCFEALSAKGYDAYDWIEKLKEQDFRTTLLRWRSEWSDRVRHALDLAQQQAQTTHHKAALEAQKGNTHPQVKRWHKVIAECLDKEHFTPQKGDVARVARMLYDRGFLPASGPYVSTRISQESVSSVAKICLASPFRSSSKMNSVDAHPQKAAAMIWTQNRITNILARSGFLDIVARSALDAALTDEKFVEDDGSQDEVFYLDTGDHLIATGQPYDLADFVTIGDFLKEPTNAPASITNNWSGNAPGKQEEWLEELATERVFAAISEALNTAASTAPKTLKPFLIQATSSEEARQRFAYELYDERLGNGEAESTVVETVANLDFRDALTRLCPEALPRLQADIEKKEGEKA
jgi:hypothetical protein